MYVRRSNSKQKPDLDALASYIEYALQDAKLADKTLGILMESALARLAKLKQEARERSSRPLN